MSDNSEREKSAAEQHDPDGWHRGLFDLDAEERRRLRLFLAVMDDDQIRAMPYVIEKMRRRDEAKR